MPEMESERAAQDLRRKGKVKASGELPEQSIWRYRVRAWVYWHCFATSLRRVFHVLVVIVIVAWVVWR